MRSTCVFILLGVLAGCQAAIRGSLSATSSGGLRIAINDEAGTQLVAVHYSINNPLPGVKAGQWNYDIRSKSGGQWVHENNNVKLKNGDMVHYWLYRLKNTGGEQITNQRWTVTGVSGSVEKPTNTDTNTPANTNNNVDPVVSGSGGDQVWKGRKLKLVMDDNFSNGINKQYWEHEITLSGGGNWEFQAYTDLPQNSFTKDGKLYLKPTLTADKYGENFLTTGVWDMQQYYGKCTDGSAWGCNREGKNGFLNPAMSAKLKSIPTIKYGKIEISAKMPRGDWIWPALWMLPSYGGRNGGGKYGGWPKSGEIDIMESRGNRNYGTLGVDYLGSTLHWGTDGVNKYGMTTKHKKCTKCSLADGQHKYTFLWDQTEMIFYLDDEHIATFSTPSQGFFRWGNLPGTNIWAHANNAPFDQDFYLIMNVAIGGTNGFFPDNVPNGSGAKPWSNQDWNGPEKFWKGRGQWYSTWKGDDAAMQVDYVKMWQLV